MKQAVLILAISAFFLSGCSTVGDFLSFGDTAVDVVVEGERISILELQEDLVADARGHEETGVELAVPQPWTNQFWPQKGGYPNHSMQHLALSPNPLQRAWKSSIGRGTYADIPLVTQPIIVANVIFTLDASASLRALDSRTGKRIWRQNVGMEDDPVIAGGLAYSNKRLYLATGYNEILAVDATNGMVLWRRTLSGPTQAAPSIFDGRVYVQTADNRLHALAESDGSLLWNYEGIGENTGIVGTTSPAVNREVVVSVFSSGEIAALRVENGSLAWGESLGTKVRGQGLANITDIQALPVIDKGLLLAVNFSGQMAALDMRSGARVWQRDIGSANTPWVAGDLVFVLSSDNHLVAMRRDSGFIEWVKKVPSYEDPEDRKGLITWQGPMLAGGRLILAGSEGSVLELNPNNGDIIHQQRFGAGFTVAPIVADETLYLLSDNAMLYALR